MLQPQTLICTKGFPQIRGVSFVQVMLLEQHYIVAAALSEAHMVAIPPILRFLPTEEVDTVTVDLDRLVASRMLIQASSGGGKSWALRYLLEQTFGQILWIPENLTAFFPETIADTSRL